MRLIVVIAHLGGEATLNNAAMGCNLCFYYSNYNCYYLCLFWRLFFSLLHQLHYYTIILLYYYTILHHTILHNYKLYNISIYPLFLYCYTYSSTSVWRSLSLSSSLPPSLYLYYTITITIITMLYSPFGGHACGGILLRSPMTLAKRTPCTCTLAPSTMTRRNHHNTPTPCRPDCWGKAEKAEKGKPKGSQQRQPTPRFKVPLELRRYSTYYHIVAHLPTPTVHTERSVVC